MNIQENVVHGHENLHASTLSADDIRKSPIPTTNLEKIALLPSVMSAMAGFAYSWPLVLQIKPAMVFRADRSLSPSGLDHWTPKTLGHERLVIRAHENGEQIDAILFSITKRHAKGYRVSGEILGWIRFVGTDDEVTPTEDVLATEIVEPYLVRSHFSSNAHGQITDGQATLLIGQTFGELDSRADALAWLGQLVADPEAWEPVSLFADRSLWPQ